MVKLKSKADGPFKVLKRIRGNAYKIELSGDCNVSAIFNIVDFLPYYEGDPQTKHEDKFLSTGGE